MIIIPINIYNNGSEINLLADSYYIDLLGGWKVDIGNFSIYLENVETGLKTNASPVFWRPQSFILCKMAKRIFTIKVTIEGTYKVWMNNPDSLKVKSLNLPIYSLLVKPTPNERLEIYFNR